MTVGGTKLIRLLLAETCGLSLANDALCTNFEYSHGISYPLPLKYDADFTHYEYTSLANLGDVIT